MRSSDYKTFSGFKDKSTKKSKLKKPSKVVTQEQLNAFRKKTNNPKAELRDYLNAERGLTRRKDPKPKSEVKPRSEQMGPKRADQLNITPSKSTANKKRADRLNMMGERNTRPKRADASNMDPNAKSTKLNPLIRGIKESIEKSGRNFPVKKKKLKAGGIIRTKKKKNVDGIAKKGKTKGRII